jgi:hypothetical protein
LRSLALVVALVCLVPGLRAQSFSLDWFSVDGGGGTSSGGGYSVSGTIGQPDAGVMSGGSFTLQGGFWSLPSTAPLAGAPTLSVTQSDGVVRIAWAHTATGWVLESTPALSGVGLAWTPVNLSYQNDGSNFYLTFNAPSGDLFFRLRNP